MVIHGMWAIPGMAEIILSCGSVPVPVDCCCCVHFDGLAETPDPAADWVGRSSRRLESSVGCGVKWN